MRSKSIRIIFTALLATALSFSVTFAETDLPAPGAKPAASADVSGTIGSEELPQDQTDQDIPADDQDETSGGQQEEQQEGQEHPTSQDISSEEDSSPANMLSKKEETPAEQEEESAPVYEIQDIDGVLYYVDAATGEKYSESGFVTHTDGKLYYILEGGMIAVNKTVSADGKKYHAGSDGAMLKGLHNWNGHLCFSDGRYVLRTDPSFVSISGKRYYVLKGGVIAENRIVRVDGDIYHIGNKGVIRTGVHKWDGNYYYSHIKTGKVIRKAGFIKYNNRRYYVRAGGKIACKKFFRVKGRYYRSYSDGRIATGVHSRGGRYYFSDPKTGEWIRTRSFRRWNKKLYYIQSGGLLAANKVFAVKNRAYYANAKGCVTCINVSRPSSSVLAAAQSQVGIMTGEKYWDWYFGTRFVDTDRTPWCGTFVAWCYSQAGMYWKISSAGNTAYVPCYTWFANRNGLWISKTYANSGDIVVFGRDRHVGIVERVYKDYLITIEGNSGPTAAYGCGLPGAVSRRVYSIHDGDIKGIIRP